MRADIDRRVIEIAEYIAASHATVRAAAKRYSVSKSTVHKDISERLKELDFALYSEVRNVLDTNKEERHIRGGLATKRKYMEIGGRSKEEQ